MHHYTSKAFTSSQRNYAQIEKELAAVVFGCQRFHQYVFGKEFLVESDHKPLQSILKKPLVQTPPRLQRMLLQLQKYSLQVKNKKGTEMYIPDALSRNHDVKMEVLENEVEAVQISQLDVNVNTVPMSTEKLQEVRTATRSDETLNALYKMVLNRSWPETKDEMPNILKAYWEFQDELTVERDLIFKNHKLIIPKSLQRYMYRSRNVKEPMRGTAKQGAGRQPNLPWQKIATDLFELNSEYYIVLVDYYSSFFEINKLCNLRSESVIHVCKQHFSRYGVPEVLNMFLQHLENLQSNMDSKMFQVHPNIHSLMVRQIAKRILKKAKASGQDPYLALLDYRNTPLEGLPSPAQLLMEEEPEQHTQLQSICSNHGVRSGIQIPASQPTEVISNDRSEAEKQFWTIP